MSAGHLNWDAFGDPFGDLLSADASAYKNQVTQKNNFKLSWLMQICSYLGFKKTKQYQSLFEKSEEKMDIFNE